jgi:hypothetical protein
MFYLLPQRGSLYVTAGIPVQDPSTGTMATPQSQIALRRTVVLTEAACQEEDGCEDGDARDARCPGGLNALSMTGPCVEPNQGR